MQGYTTRGEHERDGRRVAPAAIKTEEINVVGVRGSQSAGGGDRNGDARRGARSPHVWRAVRDAYIVNSGGRRVAWGRRAAEARGARRAARHERGGFGGGARRGALRAARKEQGQVGNGAPCDTS